MRRSYRGRCWGLQAQVGGVAGEDVFEVVQHVLGLAQCADAFRAHGLELVMRHRQQDGIINALLQRGNRGVAIFELGFGDDEPGAVLVGL